MDNLSKWQFYMQNCNSPSSYIDMGFYYLISAALQRRVFLGSDEKPLFANQYIIFVGPPGIGKGEVLIPVAGILREHKLRKNLATSGEGKQKEGAIDPVAAQALLQEFQAANPHLDKQINGVAPPKRLEEPLAIPIAADATTYEALLRAHSFSLRTAHYNGTSSLLKNGMYSHSSLCYCLEEISSLFRKHAEDTVRYLIRAYDCQNYVYDAKTPGLSDRILSPCLNFLGGTQPSFIHEIFKDRLLTEGFASRTIFVNESAPRSYRYDIFNYSEEQLKARKDLVEHVGKLIGLFGRVAQTPAAYEFMKQYVETILPQRGLRPNTSTKLDHYYARKKVHTEKMALAIHFGESTEMTIDVGAYQKAVELTNKLELTMDSSLNVGGRNPLAVTSNKIIGFLKREGPMSFPAIWREYVDEVNEKELMETLGFLIQTSKVSTVGEAPIKYYVKT